MGPEGASRWCCKFSGSPGGDAPRESQQGMERQHLDNQKSLGTDASTASERDASCLSLGKRQERASVRGTVGAVNRRARSDRYRAQRIPNST